MNFIDDNVISKCQLISEPQPKVSPTPAHICLVISMSFQLYISMKGGHKRKYTAYTFSKTLERCTETTLSKNKHFSVDLEHAGLYVGFCLTEQTRWLLFECTMSTWTLNPDARLYGSSTQTHYTIPDFKKKIKQLYIFPSQILWTQWVSSTEEVPDQPEMFLTHSPKNVLGCWPQRFWWSPHPWC